MEKGAGLCVDGEALWMVTPLEEGLGAAGVGGRNRGFREVHTKL